MPRLARFVSGHTGAAHLTLLEIDRSAAAGPELFARSDFRVWRGPRPDTMSYAVHASLAWGDKQWELVLDSVLRVALAYHLSLHGGFLLHASGWLDPVHGAAVFFGPSGAGKTTTVRAAADGAVLCDETVAIRMDRDGFRAFGTPFSTGDANRQNPVDGPLVGAYALVQDERGRGVRPLSRVEALERLMGCVMLHGPDAASLAGVLRTAGALVDAGLVRALHLGLHQDVWPLLAGGE